MNIFVLHRPNISFGLVTGTIILYISKWDYFWERLDVKLFAAEYGAVVIACVHGWRLIPFTAVVDEG